MYYFLNKSSKLFLNSLNNNNNNDVPICPVSIGIHK